MYFGCPENLLRGVSDFRLWRSGRDRNACLCGGKFSARPAVAPFLMKEGGGRRRFVRGIGVLVALMAGATSSLAVAENMRVLRVAADPNNLPFSNERREGFENKIAELVAQDLGAKLEYMWWPQRRGFFRETLGAGRANLVISVPAGFERVLTTRPYYRSGYVFVYRKGVAALTSFDDPRLRQTKIGVQLIGDDGFNAPPAHALAARGIVENVRGYTVYGNYANDSPPSAIIRAVAYGEVDVAIAWGPMAGYFARRESVPLEINAVVPESDGPMLPLTFEIAMGVRREDQALRDGIQQVIERRNAEILKILDEFGVPRLALENPKKESDHVVAR